MAKIEDNSDDFMMRVMDILADAGQRQLQKIEPKKIKEIVSKLDVVKDEQRAALDLRKSQKEQYEAVYEEISSYIATMSRGELLELPEDVKLEIENVERKIRKATVAAAKAAAGEEAAPEPE